MAQRVIGVANKSFVTEIYVYAFSVKTGAFRAGDGVFPERRIYGY